MKKKQQSHHEELHPKVHKELEGFDISINSFGEVNCNLNIDKINEFLNHTVEDKKLVNRKDVNKHES